MSYVIARSLRCHAAIRLPSYAFRVGNSELSKRCASRAYKPLPGKIAPETIKAVSHTNKTPVPHQKAFVNPPESTLPPPLDVPEREPNQGTVGYYFKVGKSYWKFYKTALKAILSNHKQSSVIASRARSKKIDGRTPSFETAVRSGLLTRAEFQFILRSRRDIRRLPILGILLVIMGEYLPLLVIFLSGLVPRTAWIPKQTLRSRTKIETRREESFRRGTLQEGTNLATLAKVQGLEGLNASQILHISRSLGLHSTFWETFWDRPPRWLARRRVSRAIGYLSADDLAIFRDGGVTTMSDEELKLACEERGVDVLKSDITTLRNHLKTWLKYTIKEDIGLPAMTLVRPNQWSQFGAAKK